MNQWCTVVEKPLLERIQSELEADPDLYDVTFSVGPQKTKVKALKIILVATSPVFKNEFRTKWDIAVVKDEEGIPLPDFDGDSFQLFVKLTSLDAWSADGLEKLKLPLYQLLDLLSICRRYEMLTAVQSLEKLKAAYLLSFVKFKYTADFLKLSQANLKEILASDDLPLEETEVFKCALKEEAGSICGQPSIPSWELFVRNSLPDNVIVTDFTSAMELKELLSAEEALKIYKYIGLDNSKRHNFDVKSLAFKAKRRNSVLLAKKVSNSAELQPQTRQTPGAKAAAQKFEVKPPLCVQLKGTPTENPFGCSTLSLLNNSRKLDRNTPFVCDGRSHEHLFGSAQRVAVIGLGFAGPIDANAFYDVTVDIRKTVASSSSTGGILKKRIYAKKRDPFYFVFDEPVIVEATSLSDLNNLMYSTLMFRLFGSSSSSNILRISYSLKGPNTYFIGGKYDQSTTLQEKSILFRWRFLSNQLSEILFTRL